jgi:hypothetical protein
MIAGWGRHFCDWEDKVAVSRHVWEQSECVRRVRERLTQFPGTTGNLDQPVSERLETLVNGVLEAPSHEDAIDGMFQLLIGAQVKSYLAYTESAHPVHDAPTVAMLSEVVRIKEQMRLWLRDRRRRIPHRTDPTYKSRVLQLLAECEELLVPLGLEKEPALPVGVRTGFRPPRRAAHPKGSERKVDLMPYLEADFSHSVEARRLFWCYGYLLEMNLAEDQLIWLYDAHGMPWEFLQDVSRHMWDESRHGDSGYSRLLDFGIGIEEIGFSFYDPALPNASPVDVAEGEAAVMDATSLYQAVFWIGMVAETGHFTVKHEAYDDFREGGDMESAEMMLFDIIDETTHVQYAHKWLPFLAERAGISPDQFKAEGAAHRARLLQEATERADRGLSLPHEGPAWELYQQLLQRMRDQVPLANAETCPKRSYKPM